MSEKQKVVQLKTRKAISIIGVDVGSCSLRAAQLRRTNSGWRFCHWVNLETEPTSPDPPHILDNDQLRLVFGPGAFTGRTTAMVLSPPDVEYQIMDVPSAILSQPASQLRTALQIELDRQMEKPLAESEIAAWPVKPESTGIAPAMVVAANRATLQQRLDLFSENRLQCVAADVVGNAMIHLQQAGLGIAASDASSPLWGVLDLGFHSSRLYLNYENRPVYARVLRSGGCAMTTQLAEALHVDFAVAERYKRIYGIQPTSRGYRSKVGGLSRITKTELPGVLYSILRPMLDTLVHEIERSYRFAMGQFPGAGVGPLYLIGGGARLQGLSEVLESYLGVPIHLPAPATPDGENTDAHSTHDSTAFKPSNFALLAACAGAALREESR